MIPKAALDWYNSGKSKGLRPDELRNALSDQGYSDAEIDFAEGFSSLKHSTSNFVLALLKSLSISLKILIGIILAFMVLFIVFLFVDVGIGNAIGSFLIDIFLIVSFVFLIRSLDRILFSIFKFFDKLLP